MTEPTLTRRHFSTLCAALGTWPYAKLVSASGQPAFLSAYRDASGQFGVAALDDTGKTLFTEALPARGHDTAVSPDGRTAVTFARRPGRFALVFDPLQMRPAVAFEAAPGRHFYGHGFFSQDGRLLLATENDYDGERGVIGLYDVAARFRRVGEFETHGIGPHEALLLSGGRTLVVANGGILTHPDFPRRKLNVPTMQPSLVYIDIETGALLEQVGLPADLHQLSIRHITQAGDGQLGDGSVWFGGQYEGAATETVPLIGRHRRGQPIELIGISADYHSRLRQYVGSIAASKNGAEIAVTSPRGGVALVLDARRGEVLRSQSVDDVCGVASAARHFAFTTGQGAVRVSGLGGGTTSSAVQWDNHLLAI